jgi:hypothetical protein
MCNAELLMHSQMHSDTDVELADTGPDAKPPTEPQLRAVYDVDQCRARCRALIERRQLRGLDRSYVYTEVLINCLRMQASVVYTAEDPPKQARASAVLINCSATAAAAAIPFGCFVLTASTDCSISTLLHRSYTTARSTGPAIPFCSTVPTSYFTTAATTTAAVATLIECSVLLSYPTILPLLPTATD